MILSTLEQALLITMIFFLMIGIGCSLDLNKIKEIVRLKSSITTGLILQYLTMPLVTLLICKTLGFAIHSTYILLLISCCPGGTTSNMFSYFSKANVELSIILTTITTSLAFLMTPLLLSFYSMGLDSTIQIPALKLIAILLSILIPTLLGLFIKAKSRELAIKVEKIGSLIGGLAILVMVFIWTPKLYRILIAQDAILFFSIGAICFIGIFLGFMISKLLKRPSNDSKAIGLEIGIQNAPLAFAIVSLSLPKPIVEEWGWIPLVYGALSVGVSTLYVFLFRLINALQNGEKKV